MKATEKITTDLEFRSNGSVIRKGESCPSPANLLGNLHKRIWKSRQTNKYYPSHFPSQYREKLIPRWKQKQIEREAEIKKMKMNQDNNNEI